MADGALLTHITKAAEQLGLSVPQVRGLIARDELPSVKVANRTYIPADAITQFVEGISAQLRA